MTLREMAVEKARQGIPPQQIAEELQVERGTVGAWLCRARARDPSIPRFGPISKGRPPVPDETVNAIATRQASGQKYRDIAVDLGVPFGTVATVISRLQRAKTLPPRRRRAGHE